MTYEVVPSPRVRRQLAEELPLSIIGACFAFIYGDLAANPHRVGKPLMGPLEGRYSARRGQYRIIYSIDETANEVHVLSVEHRRDAYRVP
jgi:mRNA interferase RelE/StbE